VLAVATAQSPEVVEERLAPALERGVLVAEGVHDAVRFRHDRIREAILADADADVDAEFRSGLQLALARRLAARPELYLVAAEQYLPVVEAVTGAAERSEVVTLLRRAAEQASVVGVYSQAETLLSTALRIADPGDTATLVELHTGRHAALFCLGRLEEADTEYGVIERLCTAGWTRRACRCAA